MKRKKQWALLMAAVMLTVTPTSTALANEDTVIIIDEPEGSAVAEDVVEEEAVSNAEIEKPNTAAKTVGTETEDLITADATAYTEADAMRGENDGISIISVEPVEEVPAAVTDETVAADTSVESAEIEINAANFPDEFFREYVSEKFDTDGSGGLSAEEIETTKSISVSKLGISSLDGIEYFTELKSLYCPSNNLSSLDVSQNTALIDLYCPDNNLSSLNVSQNSALQYLYCAANNLSSLDVSQNTALQKLYCYDNNLSSLDVSQNSALQYLSCYGNNLSSLDVSQNSALQYLGCSYNDLDSLDVSQNSALQLLDCYGNNLSSLDVSQNSVLQYLSCSYNNLSSLDVSQNSALQYLYCYDNILCSLDVSQNSALQYLYCYDNCLSSLDVSGCAALEAIKCGHQYISVLASSPDDILSISLSALVGGGNIGNVALEDGTEASISGDQIVFSGSSVPESLTYYYTVSNGSVDETMAVELSFPEKNIFNWTVTLAPESSVYDGTEKAPSVTITDGSGAPTAGTNYTVFYNDNVNAGTAKVTIRCFGDEYGLIIKTFTIAPADISDYTVLLSDSTYTWDGETKEPTVNVRQQDDYLTPNVDYTVSYENNRNAGTAAAIATGKGNYTGTASKTFTINKASQDLVIMEPAAIKVGETGAITASSQGTISYISQDASIATVNSNGIVTGIAPGSVVITVQAAETENYNFASKIITVTVIEGTETLTSPAEVGSVLTDPSGNGTYTVTGAGTNPTVTYTGTASSSAASVTIPDTVTINGMTYQVTAIADNAFKGNTSLTSVTIGANVTTIGASAFYGCSALTTVNIPSAVTAINASSFAECTALKTVTGCSAVTSIGAGAFSGDTKLTTVKGMKKATTIESKAFYKCKKLTTVGSKASRVTLEKVKTIGASAFYGCTSITYVNLTSKALTTIKASAFQGCTSLKTFVSKSTKLKTIGKKAFYKDKKLASVAFKTAKLASSKTGANAFKGIKSTCTFKVPSAKVSAYKKLFKANGAGSKITVKKA